MSFYRPRSQNSQPSYAASPQEVLQKKKYFCGVWLLAHIVGWSDVFSHGEEMDSSNASSLRLVEQKRQGVMNDVDLVTSDGGS